MTQQIPPAPAPVAVRLDAATTALIVLDTTEATCAPQPNCVAMLPTIAKLVDAARAAGVFVLYTTGAAPTTVLAAAKPDPMDPVVAGGQDKFWESGLDEFLNERGINTLVLAGWRANGSVMYTSFGATLRGYTVVVADDAIAAPADFMLAIGRYQILNQLLGNPTNEPLRERAVTLSRTDLISFR